MSKVKLQDLKLGDVVKLGPGAFMDATVVEVPYMPSDDRRAKPIGKYVVRRPYLIADDFSHSGRHGGLAVGFGIWAEDVEYLQDSSATFDLVFRRTQPTR